LKERRQHRCDRRRVGLRSHRPVARASRQMAGQRGRVGDSHREAPLPRLSVAL